MKYNLFLDKETKLVYADTSNFVYDIAESVYEKETGLNYYDMSDSFRNKFQDRFEKINESNK